MYKRARVLRERPFDNSHVETIWVAEDIPRE